MAGPPPYPDDETGDSGDNTAVVSDLESAANTPRWVHVFGFIALVLVLLFVVLHLTGRGLGGHA